MVTVLSGFSMFSELHRRIDGVPDDVYHNGELGEKWDDTTSLYHSLP